MLFSELEIHNFRSINDSGIKIVFNNSTNFYCLIGANNAGKTNILDALALGLGIRNGKFYDYKISATDFYNQDTSKPVSIKVTLHQPLKYRNVYQQECSIQGFIYEAKIYTIGENKGRIHNEHYCFGVNGKGKFESPLVDSEKMYKKAKNDGSDDDMENQRLPVLAKDQVYKLGNAYFLDIQNLVSFFKTTGYGPLGRLFQIYKDNFQTQNSIYKYKDNGVEKQTTSKNAFDKTAARISEILKTDKLVEIEGVLSKNITEYLGLEPNQKTTISLGLPSPDELFENLTRLKIEESPNIKPLEIADLGSGYLSLFRLAVLRALSEMTQKDKAIYIIEEPEIYLHPHLRRFFYKTLQLLAKQGNQIIYSTHSEEFVSLDNYQSIIRVDKSNSLNTEVYQVLGTTVLDFSSINRKIQRKGNEEIFFAQHIVLTEGQDDQAVIFEIICKKGTDCDAKSISIVDCDGKGQILDYIQLCKSLNIDYYVIFDTDQNNPKSASETKKIILALNNDTTKYQAFPNTLESALKTTKQSSENWRHLLGIIDPLDYTTIQTSYPEVVGVIEPYINKL